MKLISINVEGRRHTERVTEFLLRENPDVVCLQEVQPDLEQFLISKQYTVAFVPMTLRENESGVNEEGILLASKYPATFSSFYYYEPQGKLRVYEKNIWRQTCAECVVFAEIIFGDKKYVVATTHFTWTQNGNEPNQEQTTDMVSLIKKLEDMPPHIICGDFNIPRHQSYLYEALAAKYVDAIPASYKSSLDKNLHRLGTRADKSVLFEEYMVDYVFTETPYSAADVRLEFGVSDHAAIVATIRQ